MSEAEVKVPWRPEDERGLDWCVKKYAEALAAYEDRKAKLEKLVEHYKEKELRFLVDRAAAMKATIEDYVAEHHDEHLDKNGVFKLRVLHGLVSERKPPAAVEITESDKAVKFLAEHGPWCLAVNLAELKKKLGGNADGGGPAPGGETPGAEEGGEQICWYSERVGRITLLGWSWMTRITYIRCASWAPGGRQPIISGTTRPRQKERYHPMKHYSVEVHLTFPPGVARPGRPEIEVTEEE